MAGKTKTATSTQTAEPWKEQAPFLKDAMGEAQGLYNSGFNADQQAGMAGIRNMGSNPNSGYNQAMSHWKGALAGGPDDAVFQNVQSKVMPSVASMFSNAGRYGSGLHADTSTRALTEAYSPFAQQQMNAAAGALPAMEGANAQSLLGIGGMPQEALMKYLQGITGAGTYASTTSKTPYYQPSLLGQVGGYVLGNAAQAAKMYGGGGSISPSQ